MRQQRDEWGTQSFDIQVFIETGEWDDFDFVDLKLVDYDCDWSGSYVVGCPMDCLQIEDATLKAIRAGLEGGAGER